jgi:3-hydroxyisobutyrate dehydrogenase/glyoxylate/succinic semialdehyde reductase
MKIGFIGLGIMGSRMAKNLIKAGYDLIVWNRTKEKAKEFHSLGAKIANTPKEVAMHSNILFTMLSDPKAVEEVALNNEGFLPHMLEGSIWVNTSTVDPFFTLKMYEIAKSFKVEFLDAPVLGSKDAAENSKLVFIVGGDRNTFRKVEPLLYKMGHQVIHVGEVGKGSSMKLVVNLMLGVSMIAFSEALALGESLGIDKNFLADTLSELPVAPPFLKRKRDKIKRGDFDVEFPLELMHKDLYLASLMGYEKNVSMFLTNMAMNLFGYGKKLGLARRDFSIIYKIVKGEV